MTEPDFERHLGAGVYEFKRTLPDGTIHHGYRCARGLNTVVHLDPATGHIASMTTPEPSYWGILPWIWKRLTGWRDDYGRKAQLMWPWE